MKRYSLIFHPDAETDVSSIYRWGRRAWGDTRADSWVGELKRVIQKRLTSLPLSCALAPESEDVGVEVRQLIVQRYRILFIVEKRTVTILHVRGPYRGSLDSSEAEQQ
jgi:plasmid stabilization system protein ParE